MIHVCLHMQNDIIEMSCNCHTNSTHCHTKNSHFKGIYKFIFKTHQMLNENTFYHNLIDQNFDLHKKLSQNFYCKKPQR